MGTIRRILAGLASALLLLVLIAFATSWHVPVFFDVWESKGDSVEIASRRGRIEVYITTGFEEFDTTQTPAIGQDDLKALDSMMQESTIVATPAESRWRWLAFDDDVTVLPQSWFGGGIIRRTAIPYWLLALPAGFAIVILRRRSGGKERMGGASAEPHSGGSGGSGGRD